MRVAFVCSGKPDNLKYLKNNRDLVSETFSNHGWEVVNTPLSNISDLNRRLHEYSKNTIDEFIFFYTGHGDVSNRQQILKLQLDNTEISMNDVLDSIFKYINPKKQAIILDACYSGTLKDLALEKNTEFLFSSQAREQSYEDSKLNSSIFSFYFCEAVSNGYLTLKEISNYIASKSDRQKPLPLLIGSEFINISQKDIKLKFISIDRLEKSHIKNFFHYINYIDMAKKLMILVAFLIFIILFKKNISLFDSEKLLISTPKNNFLALDGHEAIKKNGISIFHSGVKINLTLSHNMKGKQSIIIREINLNLIRYDKNTSFNSQIDESKIGGSGTINPRSFRSILFKNKKIKTKNNQKTYLGKNILKDQLLKLSILDDIEEIRWQILVVEEGLYTLNYDIIYSIGDKDSIFVSNNFKVFL